MTVRNETFIRAVLNGKTIQYFEYGPEEWVDLGGSKERQIRWLLETTVWEAPGIRIKPDKKVVWVNVYEDGEVGVGRPTKEEADEAARVCSDPIARLKIEYEDGQFDE